MIFYLVVGVLCKGCNIMNRGGMIDDSGKFYSIMGQNGDYLVNWRKVDSNLKNVNVQSLFKWC